MYTLFSARVQDVLLGVDNTVEKELPLDFFIPIPEPYDHFSDTNSLPHCFTPSTYYLCGVEPDVSWDNCRLYKVSLDPEEEGH